MKQSEAIQHVRNALFAAQKARSNLADALFGPVALLPDGRPDPADPLLRFLRQENPYLFGETSTLVLLLDALVSGHDRDGSLAPSHFFNAMALVSRSQPHIGLVSVFYHTGFPPFPEPEVGWLPGWEPE